MFHHPILRRFSYYMRIDGGDSRLDDALVDPFRLMQERGLRYIGNSEARSGPSPEFSKAHADFAAGHPQWRWNGALLQPFWDNSTQLNTGGYYYNNLELADLRVFRSRVQWEYFLAVDQEQAYMFPRRGGIGDGEVRSFSVALLCNESHVMSSGAIIKYRHPVLWDVD